MSSKPLPLTIEIVKQHSKLFACDNLKELPSKYQHDLNIDNNNDLIREIKQTLNDRNIKNSIQSSVLKMIKNLFDNQCQICVFKNSTVGMKRIDLKKNLRHQIIRQSLVPTPTDDNSIIHFENTKPKQETIAWKDLKKLLINNNNNNNHQLITQLTQISQIARKEYKDGKINAKEHFCWHHAIFEYYMENGGEQNAWFIEDYSLEPPEHEQWNNISKQHGITGFISNKLKDFNDEWKKGGSLLPKTTTTKSSPQNHKGITSAQTIINKPLYSFNLHYENCSFWFWNILHEVKNNNKQNNPIKMWCFFKDPQNKLHSYLQNKFKHQNTAWLFDKEYWVNIAIILQETKKFGVECYFYEQHPHDIVIGGSNILHTGFSTAGAEGLQYRATAGNMGDFSKSTINYLLQAIQQIEDIDISQSCSVCQTNRVHQVDSLAHFLIEYKPYFESLIDKWDSLESDLIANDISILPQSIDTDLLPSLNEFINSPMNNYNQNHNHNYNAVPCSLQLIPPIPPIPPIPFIRPIPPIPPIPPTNNNPLPSLPSLLQPIIPAIPSIPSIPSIPLTNNINNSFNQQQQQRQTIQPRPSTIQQPPKPPTPSKSKMVQGHPDLWWERVGRNDNNNLMMWKCPLCKKVFDSNSKMAHFRRVHEHDKQKEKYQCKKCSKSYTTKYSLTIHMDCTHYKLKKFVCPNPKCSKEFTRKESLIYHLEKSKGGNNPCKNHKRNNNN